MLQVHLVNISTKGSLLSTPTTVLSDSYSLETLRHIVELPNCVILQYKFVQIGPWSTVMFNNRPNDYHHCVHRVSSDVQNHSSVE